MPEKRKYVKPKAKRGLLSVKKKKQAYKAPRVKRSAKSEVPVTTPKHEAKKRYRKEQIKKAAKKKRKVVPKDELKTRRDIKEYNDPKNWERDAKRVRTENKARRKHERRQENKLSRSAKRQLDGGTRARDPRGLRIDPSSKMGRVQDAISKTLGIKDAPDHPPRRTGRNPRLVKEKTKGPRQMPPKKKPARKKSKSEIERDARNKRLGKSPKGLKPSGYGQSLEKLHGKPPLTKESIKDVSKKKYTKPKALKTKDVKKPGKNYKSGKMMDATERKLKRVAKPKAKRKYTKPTSKRGASKMGAQAIEGKQLTDANERRHHAKKAGQETVSRNKKKPKTKTLTGRKAPKHTTNRSPHEKNLIESNNDRREQNKVRRANKVKVTKTLTGAQRQSGGQGFRDKFPKGMEYESAKKRVRLKKAKTQRTTPPPAAPPKKTAFDREVERRSKPNQKLRDKLEGKGKKKVAPKKITGKPKKQKGPAAGAGHGQRARNKSTKLMNRPESRITKDPRYQSKGHPFQEYTTEKYKRPKGSVGRGLSRLVPGAMAVDAVIDGTRLNEGVKRVTRAGKNPRPGTSGARTISKPTRTSAARIAPSGKKTLAKPKGKTKKAIRTEREKARQERRRTSAKPMTITAKRPKKKVAKKKAPKKYAPIKRKITKRPPRRKRAY